MTAATPSPHPGLSFFAFVTAIACIQASVAMSIDMMVPALGQIAAALHAAQGNERQWVITAFVLAFGGAQPCWRVRDACSGGTR